MVNGSRILAGTLVALLGVALHLTGADAGGLTSDQVSPTRVTVRVVSRDGKIIGSGVGGALIRITDAESGELLAEGTQEGGTGDTRRILNPTPEERGKQYDTEGAAGYRAELMLAEPTFVTITGIGPMDYPQAKGSASKTMLLIPGRHVEGDGVILELNGFIVEVTSPETGARVEGEIPVTARVRLMCGCLLEPGGLWDSNTKVFLARLKADGEVVSTSSLRFSGQASVFEGTVPVPATARGAKLEMEVLAADSTMGNFGRHQIALGGGGGG
ncbi:MAG: hypothetical protein ACWGSQ_13465 [Longimicrobiales bacterium]